MTPEQQTARIAELEAENARLREERDGLAAVVEAAKSLCERALAEPPDADTGVLMGVCDLCGDPSAILARVPRDAVREALAGLPRTRARLIDPSADVVYAGDVDDAIAALEASDA